jgi:hypothetical protein
MKFKISFISIILVTLALIGLINIVINKISKTKEAKPDALSAQKPSDPLPKKTEANNVGKNLNNNDELDDDDDDDDEEDLEASLMENKMEYNNNDKTKILNISELSDDEVVKKLSQLETKISQDSLMDKLDDKNLPFEQKIQLHAILEDYVLLGLEQKRRKYMSLEPNLKDPLLAHKDSLAEIRALLRD